MSVLKLIAPRQGAESACLSPEGLRGLLGLPQGRCPVQELPFSLGDLTAGTENELQAAVVGPGESVDLVRTIEDSNYYRNIIKRHRRGEAPRQALSDLEDFLYKNREGVWENSWLRFPLERLCPLARETLAHDLLADKRDPAGGHRGDRQRFIFSQAGQDYCRVPVSYLLKLSLAQALGSQPGLPESLVAGGQRLMGHFLSDNTSPETYSFHPVALQPAPSLGRAIAAETAKRYLLTQLLAAYAGRALGLDQDGQHPLVYFAPSPPLRQRRLNDLISDSFYRELFMSPCLSGWDRGQEKHRYMGLCHQVLSRSQLNAVGKLKEAGIITNNLVVLPNLSNTCLANNGTHLSLGSRRLSALLADPASGFGPLQEKYLGDLVIKAVEHFLPLFVGTYSAAPQRLAFEDFHPERLLGFLPHELDYTHLRMMWRRWKKKARLKVLGRPLTPFGPLWLDRLLSRAFGLRGDFVPDYRLLDYFVCLLSTDQSPALDGQPGNDQRLKQDLADLGVFDPRMATYLLYRQRHFASMGFAGFEGRHYSLFESLEHDLGAAAGLQSLVTALAYKYYLQGRLSHAHIPDHPVVESERRQIFFGAAMGLPTFFVRHDTANHFLGMIIERCQRVRPSRRYPGYLRVHNHEYRRALLALIRQDAADLVECLGLAPLLADLEERLERPQEASAAGRLWHGICQGQGKRHPLDMEAQEFNLAAEAYYRQNLRIRHMAEALDMLGQDLSGLTGLSSLNCPSDRRQVLEQALDGLETTEFLARARPALLADQAGEDELWSMIILVLISIEQDQTRARGRDPQGDSGDEASIPRAAYR